MLAGCGCRPVVNHDVDGQIMLLTKKAEEKIKKIKEIEKNAEEKIKKIKEIEKNAEEKIKKIKEIEKNAEEKIKKIKEIEKNAEEKLSKKSDSGKRETPVKETETEEGKSEIHKPFSKYAYPLSAMITGSVAAFIGHKVSNYKICFVGLTVASVGAFTGIKRLLETSGSKEEKEEKDK
ncbi:hypothetical protein ATZ36_06040 [Candidatus Endomicrobiellum trichonymphae]|uniref:Uncharacterized protein n=1 Tax=Endomicrobium trichonymphae TaxID=1408204 RepID=A0A1E5II06_ENDTX|nr:hypothetical protein ATZ36_06040 [Candidatus Endomicrobium trichonymphae]